MVYFIFDTSYSNKQVALNKLRLLQKAQVQNIETLQLFREELKQTVLAKNIKMPSRRLGFRGQVFKLK